MFKLGKKNKQAGMTYVELIVVLSIFAIMSSVAIFNYGTFQANVEIKNLASDIASQIVQAQKDSINGVIPTPGAPSLDWKPSWGVYFDSSSDSDPDHPNYKKNQKFVYFADVVDYYDGYTNSSEEEKTVLITKGNSILSIDECNNSVCSPGINQLSVSFKRPNSEATFNPALTSGTEYVQVVIWSPGANPVFSSIRIYPSGRVEVR